MMQFFLHSFSLHLFLSLCFPRYFAFMLKSLQILLSLPRVAPNFAKSDLSREFRNMCQTWRNPELPTFYGRHMQNILENIWRPKDFRFFGKIIKISKISIGKTWNSQNSSTFDIQFAISLRACEAVLDLMSFFFFADTPLYPLILKYKPLISYLEFALL